MSSTGARALWDSCMGRKLRGEEREQREEGALARAVWRSRVCLACSAAPLERDQRLVAFAASLHAACSLWAPHGGGMQTRPPRAARYSARCALRAAPRRRRFCAARLFLSRSEQPHPTATTTTTATYSRFWSVLNSLGLYNKNAKILFLVRALALPLLFSKKQLLRCLRAAAAAAANDAHACRRPRRLQFA